MTQRALATALVASLLALAPPARADDPDDASVTIDVPGVHVSMRGGPDGGDVEIRAGRTRISASGDVHGGSWKVEKVPRAAGPDDVDEAELGLPFYPDADAGEGTRAETHEERFASQTLRSDDDFDDVVGFYERELSGFDVERKRFGGREVEFARRAPGTEQRVRVREDERGTLVELSTARER